MANEHVKVLEYQFSYNLIDNPIFYNFVSFSDFKNYSKIRLLGISDYIAGMGSLVF